MLPRLTHVQFFVLKSLTGKWDPALALYDHLNATGEHQFKPSGFYQVMGRMEEAGYITVRRLPHLTQYRLTAAGRAAMAESRKFYK